MDDAPPASPKVALPPDWQQRPTLTVEEAGLVLGISRWAAYHAAKRGDLPTFRIGGRVLVPTAKLLAMLGMTR